MSVFVQVPRTGVSLDSVRVVCVGCVSRLCSVGVSVVQPEWVSQTVGCGRRCVRVKVGPLRVSRGV